MKVRPYSPRLAGCVAVQRRLFEAGYPCPEPLAGPEPLGEGVATAEMLVPGGAIVPAGANPVRSSAAAFARLITLAPRPGEVPSLDPPPSWAAWDQAGAGLWPAPDDLDADLNAIAGPDWIDEAGRRARARLLVGGSAAVIGHCDWLAENMRWTGEDLLVVHDWDSACADSEDVLAGFAAALFSTASPDEPPTVAETGQFLDAYAAARGRPFTASQQQRAWAAGVWTRAFDATRQHAAGELVVSLTADEARERLRRAGIDG